MQSLGEDESESDPVPLCDDLRYLPFPPAVAFPVSFSEGLPAGLGSATGVLLLFMVGLRAASCVDPFPVSASTPLE